MRVLENRVLRRINGPKMDEITWIGEDCVMRSLIICTPHQILFVAKVLVGKPEGKRSFGRPRRRREKYIKMYLQEV
jgi:hypothetical protein